MLGAEPDSLLALCSSLAGPSRQGIQLALSLASRAWAAETQCSVLFFISFVFNRKMFPAPPTLSWAGFGNHFQMGNNFRGEEQLKLWPILPPAPRPQPWNCPEVGRASLRPGQKPGWAVETGCLAWLSRGQAMWAPANGAGYYLGAALLCQALLSHPHSSSRFPIEAVHPAAI